MCVDKFILIFQDLQHIKTRVFHSRLLKSHINTVHLCHQLISSLHHVFDAGYISVCVINLEHQTEKDLLCSEMKGIQHNYGSYSSEFASDFPVFYPQTYPAQQQSASNQSAPSTATQQHSSWHANSSGTNTIIGRIGSPAAAFCATEIAMGLSQYDFPETCSQQSKNLYPRTHPFHLSGNALFEESPARNQAAFHSPQNYQYLRSEGSSRNQFTNLSEREQILHLKNKLLGDLDDPNRRSPSVSFDSNQDLEVSIPTVHFIPFLFPLKTSSMISSNSGLTQSICTTSCANKPVWKTSRVPFYYA